MGKNGQPMAIKDLADARVDKRRGGVVCSTVNPKRFVSGMPEGVYHPFDYPFYYYDVRANAADRIQRFNASK